MNDLLTLTIAVIGAVVTYVLIPYIKSKTTKEQQEAIANWVKVAVQAVEQTIKESGQGKTKYSRVKNFLEGKGFNLTDNELDILIEAAVLELNQSPAIFIEQEVLVDE